VEGTMLGGEVELVLKGIVEVVVGFSLGLAERAGAGWTWSSAIARNSKGNF